MDRSVASVKSAAQRYRISLRKRGSRRGSVLGEARGVTLPPEVREDLRSGTVDAALIAQRMILDRDADLCPYCGRRPIRVMASGLCVPCHKEILIEKHREAIDELLARRLVDRLKQQHKRLRDGGELQASEWLG